MGIEGFNSIAKTRAESAFFNLPLSAFSGTRIAVDGNWFMHNKRKAANAKVTLRYNPMTGPLDQSKVTETWFRDTIEFVSVMYYNNIIPVFVFDGKAPALKFNTQKSRKKAESKNAAKILDLEAQINVYREASGGSILDQPPKSLIDDYKKAISWHVIFTTEDIRDYKQLLRSIGVPVLQSTTEGERLASMLAVDGLVSAVYSTDTDVNVHGAPLSIIDIDRDMKFCSCVRVDYIRKGLGMTHDEFVDLCIAAECDYNDGIPGAGEKRIQEIMGKSRFIEYIPYFYGDKYDISTLNYLGSRKLFEYVNPQTICQDPLNLDLNIGCLQEHYEWLESRHLEGLCYSVGQAMTHVSETCGSSVGETLKQLNLEPGARYKARVPFVVL